MMSDPALLSYAIKDPVELNLSYMPFIKHGGLFVPTPQAFNLGDRVLVDLELPALKEKLRITGIVVWITPVNALHHVLPGIGIQLTGADSQTIRTQIEAHLDTTIEVGGYTYGMIEEKKKT